jgi:hypothetical protein
LQRLLAAHPQIATPQETHLLDMYVAPLYARWEGQRIRLAANVDLIVRGEADVGRLLGLPSILQEGDLDGAARFLVDALIRRTTEARAQKDTALAWVLEKTPSNALHVDLLDHLVPDCRYIHVIRDPRDVAASMLAARHERWGARWAPRTADSAARMWEEHLQGARSAAKFGSTRYIEVRYEALRADTAAEVARLLDFLEVECDDVPQLVSEQGDFTFAPEIRRQIGPATREPANFSGGGRTRHSLSHMQQAIVEHRTVLVRAELGYGVTERWPATSTAHKVAVVPAATAVSAGRRIVRRRLLRVLGDRAVSPSR